MNHRGIFRVPEVSFLILVGRFLALPGCRFYTTPTLATHPQHGASFQGHTLEEQGDSR